MNIIALDIGNTNITAAFYLDNEEQFVESVPGESIKQLDHILKSAWEKIPLLKSAKQPTRDGIIVASSVKPDWTRKVQKIIQDSLNEKILLIGRDIPLPISLWVDEPQNIGTDRAVSAAAAYAVVEGPVVVADFGTAVTIDLVDEKGIFIGGAICPGFHISARSLNRNTAKLPEIKIKKPASPCGKNTEDSINAGLYYSAIGTLEEIIRRYADELGRWPHTILTGAGAKLIKDDCPFIDSYVSDLAVKGVVLAYKKYIEQNK